MFKYKNLQIDSLKNLLIDYSFIDTSDELFLQFLKSTLLYRSTKKVLLESLSNLNEMILKRENNYNYSIVEFGDINRKYFDPSIIFNLKGVGN